LQTDCQPGLSTSRSRKTQRHTPKIINTTVQKCKSTVTGNRIHAGIELLTATGSAGNERDPSGEHWIYGKGVKLVYTGVTTSVANCGVSGKPGGAGVVETNPLTATTTGKGMLIELKPEEGTAFVHR